MEAGNLKTSWTLGKRHPSFTNEEAESLATMLKSVLLGTVLSAANGAWDVSDAWNRLVPNYKFTTVEDFLTGVWEGKP